MPIPYRYPRELLPVPPIDLKDPTKQPNVIQYIYFLGLKVGSNMSFSSGKQ
jgi:hypothetical protein